MRDHLLDLVEHTLKLGVIDLVKITGDDKKMADFVVYKNFPQEVLQMSEAEYWFKQILMYWGFPNQYFTESEKERPKLEDKINFREEKEINKKLAEVDKYLNISKLQVTLPKLNRAELEKSKRKNIRHNFEFLKIGALEKKLIK